MSEQERTFWCRTTDGGLVMATGVNDIEERDGLVHFLDVDGGARAVIPLHALTAAFVAPESGE